MSHKDQMDEDTLAHLVRWWDPDELRVCPRCAEKKMTPPKRDDGTSVCLACGHFEYRSSH